MGTDTGKNNNDKVKTLMKALIEMSEKLQYPLGSYFDDLVK